MGHVLLVPHAQEAPGNGLSPLGWEQARWLGDALAARGVLPSRIVHAGAGRYRETAEGAAEAAGWDTEVLADPDWEGFDRHAITDVHPAPFGDRAPSREEFGTWLQAATRRWCSGEFDDEYAETFTMFAARIDGALERLAGERLVIVVTAPASVAWVAASLLLGGPGPTACADLWSRLCDVVVTSSVSKVVVGGRGANLVSFNEHAHLEAAALA